MPISRDENETRAYWRRIRERSEDRRLESYQEKIASVVNSTEECLGVDDKSIEEEKFFAGTQPDTDVHENQAHATQLELVQQLIKNHESDRKLREDAAGTLLKLSAAWVRYIFILLLFKGLFEKVSFTTAVGTVSVSWFSLSDSVSIALVSATGLAGLLGIVLKYLFKSNSSD
jgi:hypothetical protein